MATAPRHHVVTSRAVFKVFREAGIVDDRPVRRVVIDLHEARAAVIHVEYFGDDRMLNVARDLDGVEVRNVSRGTTGEFLADWERDLLDEQARQEWEHELGLSGFPLLDHDWIMPHDSRKNGVAGCPPNCPRRVGVEREMTLRLAGQDRGQGSEEQPGRDQHEDDPVAGSEPGQQGSGGETQDGQ